jgi:hypothetical protein
VTVRILLTASRLRRLGPIQVIRERRRRRFHRV